MQTLLMLAKREIALHRARSTEWCTVILFYLICTTLFPMAVGGWAPELLKLAPVIIWVAVLITVVLAQETLLREDFKLGVFDLLCLHSQPLQLLLLIKILTHWLIYCVPIVLVTPLVALSFGIAPSAIAIICLSLLIGTLFLSFVAAIGAVLTVPLARGGTFVALMILPLYVPVLCIGSNLGIQSVQGIVSLAHFALLGALALSATLLVPFLVATALRVSME